MIDLIDSHCHLTFKGLKEQIPAVIERAAVAGVSTFIAPGTDMADSEQTVALAAQQPSVFAAVGVHPHEAGKVADGWDEQLQELAQGERVVAVGEAGLDYHYNFSEPASQQEVFRRQLEIAHAVGKPVIIHSREAHADVMRILGAAPSLPGVVFHCFSGTADEAEQILARGYWLSWTGVVTFKRSDELRSVAKRMPIDRMMLETDAPYLSPVPLRNVQPNEPAYMIHTAKCVAEERGMSLSEFSAITVDNTRRFFGLPRD